jgi:phosphoglycolate phosphatase-like HAD superfamily hydrolase
LKPLIWVGDTEVDAEAAAILGVPCALVANGVRSRESLHGLPCLGVFSSVSEIPFTYFLGP